ncbi:uncharacterized protein V1518DRAFT_316993 [Limtongia smithiae]|uniref:uncharacterized protein n=1 Tax=Limtongia smithiae TaxID=1125753 RepID=UPI0034CD2527
MHVTAETIAGSVAVTAISVTDRWDYPRTRFRYQSALLSIKDDLGLPHEAKIYYSSTAYSGFYSAFWLVLVYMAIAPVVKQVRLSGSLASWEILSLSLTRLPELLLAEVALHSISIGCLIFQRLCAAQLIRWESSGWLLQSLFELGFLASVSAFLLYIRWPWPHFIFFLLHFLVHLMKMHSYSFYNGFLSTKYHELLTLADNEPLSERESLESELRSTLGNVNYPENLSATNVIFWLSIPTLCYELEYPRTPKVRVAHLTRMIIGLVCTIAMFYSIVEFYVLPVLKQYKAEYNQLESGLLIKPVLLVISCTLELMYPITISYLIAFVLIWQLVLNCFAEITRFGDRLFYEDWWNATSLSEYARKWNVPVQRFLWRHVYYPLSVHFSRRELAGRSQAPLSAFHITSKAKYKAMVCTFMLSSAVHELVGSLSDRRIRGWQFFFQMFQIILTTIQEKTLQSNRVLANIVNWIILIFGLAFVGTVYLVT